MTTINASLTYETRAVLPPGVTAGKVRVTLMSGLSVVDGIEVDVGSPVTFNVAGGQDYYAIASRISDTGQQIGDAVTSNTLSVPVPNGDAEVPVTITLSL